MPIIGKGFKEITAKRFDLEGEIKLGHNENKINLTNIKETRIDAGITGKILEIEYEFRVDYLLEKPKNGKLGEITIKGSITYHDEDKVMDKILKEWKKNKKINEAFMKEVLGRALYLSQIEAINQSTKVLLPPPVPIPALRTSKEEDKK